MADFNMLPRVPSATGNIDEPKVDRGSTQKRLEDHKEKIVAWYRFPATRLEDLPQLAEQELGFKPSVKAFRFAMQRWGERKYLSPAQKMRLIEKHEREGHSSPIKVNGKLYSIAQLRRPVTKNKKLQRLDEIPNAEQTSHPGEDIPMELEYYDSNDPTRDPMILDDFHVQARNQQTNINTANNYQTVQNQDQNSWETLSFDLLSLFKPMAAHGSIDFDVSRIATARRIILEQHNGITTVSLLFIWQWIASPGNFFECTKYAADFANDRARAIDLHCQYFGNAPYDPAKMAGWLVCILDNDMLQEAEEMVRLAIEISERWLDPDHVELWKAKGNLAHVYHEQGRYHEALQLETDAVNFFTGTTANLDENALVFQTNRAKTLLALGKTSEARDICLTTVRLACSVLGYQHEVTLTAKFQLAILCYKLRDHRTAGEIQLEIIVARQMQQGEKYLTSKTVRSYIAIADSLQEFGFHSQAQIIQRWIAKKIQDLGISRSMWTLELVRSVGIFLFSLQDYAGAEKYFRTLVDEIPFKVRSINHPKAVFAKIWLANSLLYQDKDKEATSINLECVGILGQVFGPNHHQTLLVKSNLACSRQRSLTLEHSEAEIANIRKQRADHFGENHQETLLLDVYCAEATWKLGKWNDAQDRLKIVQSRLENLPEPERSHVIWTYMSFAAEFLRETGEHKQAVDIQEERVKIGLRLFGKEHPEAMRAFRSLARSLVHLGRYQEAEKLLDQGISTLCGSLSRTHPAVTNLKITYANVLAEQKKWNSAEVVQREILQERKIYGEQHPFALQATRHLARTCTKLGKFPEAEKLYERALEVSKTTFGHIHIEVTYLFNGLVELMQSRQKFRDARDLYQRSWNITKRLRGSLDNRDSINASERVANALDSLGSSPESLILRHQILSSRTQTLGSLHRDTLSALSNLACTLLKLGNFTEAVGLYRDCLEKRSVVLGKWHKASLSIRSNLCNALLELSLFSECMQHSNEILAATKATAGENSMEMVVALYKHAEIFFHQRQFAQAEENLRDALRVFESIEGHSNLETKINVMVRLADCYRLSGKYGRAEVQIQAAIEYNQRHLRPDTAMLYPQSRLARIYLDAGEYNKAEILAKILCQKLEEDAKYDSRGIYGVEEVVACSMAGQGKFQDAITFLENAISKRRDRNSRDPTAHTLTDVLFKVKEKLRRHEETVSTGGSLATVTADPDRFFNSSDRYSSS